MNIFERVASWNGARYPQVYNWKLQLALLAEEFDELQVAETEVDKLDAACDIMFVALGGLWKAKLTPGMDRELESTIEQSFTECTSLEGVIQYFANALANYEKRGVELTEGDHYFINILAGSFASVFMAFELDLDPTYRQILALSIVCDSNDSKAIKKTDPSVKANIDKGAGFIAPEPRLQALLDTRLVEAQNA